MKHDSAWYKENYIKTIELLEKAYDHLQYCGFGDSWERECSEELQKELNEYFEEGGLI